MKVSKKIEGSIIECLYNSSNVLKSEYNKSKNELTIVFKSGGVYTYSNVSYDDYAVFECSESQGKSMGLIKKYSFERKPNIIVESIVSEIEALKNK